MPLDFDSSLDTQQVRVHKSNEPTSPKRESSDRRPEQKEASFGTPHQGAVRPSNCASPNFEDT
jgi:hypothetical protein